MDVSEVSTLFAAMAIGALVAAGAWIAISLVPTARPARLAVAESIGRRAPRYVAAIAAIATGGSLYYSEVAGFVPCTLCWYQRIAMYPLVVLFAVAAWRADGAGARRYGMAPAMVGLGIAAYHYGLQHFPSLDAGACSSGVSCSAAWVWKWGFASIPFMALAAFALIVVVLWAGRVGEHIEEARA